MSFRKTMNHDCGEQEKVYSSGRSSGRVTLGGVATALALSLSLLAAACGGSKADAKSAADASKAGQTPGADTVTNEDGEQVAMVDGDEGSTPRPKMNAAALSAYNAGLAAFQAGDMKGAETQFAAAVSKDPKAFEAHYSLGVVRERLGSASGAQASYQKALDLVPDYSPAVMAYVQLMVKTDRADTAASYLSDLRAKVPDSAAVLTGLAEVKSYQGNSGEAQALAKEALKKNPDFKPAMVLLARDHYRLRRLDLALYTLTAILDGYGEENPPRDKNNADARLLRALIYKEQNKRKPAMEELQKVLELRPDMIEARLNLAAYMLEAGNATEAVPLLEKALKYDAENVLVHLNLGDGYRLQGKPREAIERLQFVLRKDSEVAQAHYNLGLVYMFSTSIPGLESKDAIEKAIGEFEMYKQMAPRTRPGAGDDVDELIKRARNKKAIMEAMAEPAPAAGGDGFDDGFGDEGGDGAEGGSDDGFSDDDFDDFE